MKAIFDQFYSRSHIDGQIHFLEIYETYTVRHKWCNMPVLWEQLQSELGNRRPMMCDDIYK